MPDHVVTEIAKREGPRSSLIARDLERYYESLKDTRRRLAQKFSTEEISLILDSLNGVMMDQPFAVRMLYGGVEDSVNFDNIDHKWGVDGDALVEKLKSLSFAECAALADAAERYWFALGEGGDPDLSKALD